MANPLRRLAAFVGRPVPSYRRWIRRELDVRLGETADIQQRLVADLQARERVSEVRSQALEGEILKLRKQTATLARELEVRTLLVREEALHGARAQISTVADELRRNMEARARLASLEAVSYADGGLESLGRSVAAIGRAMVETRRRAEAAGEALDSQNQAVLRAQEELVQERGTVTATIDGLQQDVTGKLAAHEAQLAAAVSDYNAQLRAVEERLEFVRRETLYEMQAAALRPAGEPHAPSQVSRILNPDKVEWMRAAGLKLNVGCGHVQFDDYLNADQRELPGVDVQSDALSLPFEDGELAEIYAAHLIEHFSAHILQRVLLPYWHRKLRSGGTLVTIAPDGAAMLEGVTSGTMTFDDFREVLFGAQDYDGDYHYNLLTPDTYSAALKSAGFVEIRHDYVGRRNGKCFEFKISARKG